MKTTNSQQMTLDFERPENCILTMEQFNAREEAKKNLQDKVCRKWLLFVSILVLLANFISM
ncbi:MAG: hypothetical protein ACI30R_07850 [Sodaliphilus sp.]